MGMSLKFRLSLVADEKAPFFKIDQSQSATCWVASVRRPASSAVISSKRPIRNWSTIAAPRIVQSSLNITKLGFFRGGGGGETKSGPLIRGLGSGDQSLGEGATVSCSFQKCDVQIHLNEDRSL